MGIDTAAGIYQRVKTNLLAAIKDYIRKCNEDPDPVIRAFLDKTERPESKISRHRRKAIEIMIIKIDSLDKSKSSEEEKARELIKCVYGVREQIRKEYEAGDKILWDTLTAMFTSTQKSRLFNLLTMVLEQYESASKVPLITSSEKRQTISPDIQSHTLQVCGFFATETRNQECLALVPCEAQIAERSLSR